MSTNKKSNFSNIHVIPFDIGFMFYDVYTPSFAGNYYLWQEFLKRIKDLQTKSNSASNGEEIFPNEKLSIEGAVYKGVSQEIELKFKFRRPIFPIKNETNSECIFTPVKNEAKNYLNTFDDCLCEIKLQENLYCFILKSGLAVFVIGCFNNEGLDTHYKNSKNIDDAIKMRFQNEIINRALLLDELQQKYSDFLSFKNDKTEIFDENGNVKKLIKLNDIVKKDDELKIGCKDLDKVISSERKTMLLFKIWCWKTIQNIVKGINGGACKCKVSKKNKWESKRPHSSKPYFKQFGFSMSANFIINKDFNDQKKINYLQDRSLSYKKFDDPKFWDSSNNYYKKLKYQNISQSQINSQTNDDIIKVPPLNIVKMDNFNISFSSNTICIQPKKKIEINSLNDFLKETEMTDLLFAEIDVITKWFNADNCIDNDFEKPLSRIQDLQTIQGQIEYYSAELNNPTSSKVESLYLMYRRRIVNTTKVKELYGSISEKIKILKAKKIEKVNEIAEHREKFAHAIRALVDCFIAAFTAAGIAKTIIDIQRGSYNWKENLIFWLLVVGFVVVRGALFAADKIKDSKKQKDLKNK